MRHTGATLAAATGASTKELMRRMGHFSPAALIYQHAAHHRDDEIARALGRLMTAPLTDALLRPAPQLGMLHPDEQAEVVAGRAQTDPAEEQPYSEALHPSAAPGEAVTGRPTVTARLTPGAAAPRRA